jgi:hypothetical protein
MTNSDRTYDVAAYIWPSYPHGAFLAGKGRRMVHGATRHAALSGP